MSKIGTLRMPSKNWQKFYVPLSVIAFFCACTLFWYFVQQWRFTDFWSFHWNFSIVFIMGCMSASFGLVRLGQNHLLQKFFLFGFSIASLLFSLFIFLSWGVTQIMGLISITQYMGYLAIFLIFTASGIIAFVYSSDLLRYPSYFFGLASLLYIILLLSKYIFTNVPYNWNFFINTQFMHHGPISISSSYTWTIFIGEVFILLIGEIVFWSLLFNGIQDPFEDNM
jgi:hypothetical protein